MDLLGLFPSLFRQFSEFSKASRRNTGNRPGGRPGPFIFAGASSGSAFTGAWTDSRVEQVRHFKHWVYVAVSRICDKVAHMQPTISVVRDAAHYHTPEAKFRRKALGYMQGKTLVQLQDREHLEAVNDDHPLVRLLRNPNEYDTAFDLWYETTLFEELTGSAYWWTPLNKIGLPEELWVLPSHWMWPVVGQSKMIEAYEMRPVEGRHFSYRFPAEEIIHFKRKSPVSKVDGYATTTAIAQWIDANESIDRAFWFAYKNGILPSLQIELDPQITDPDNEKLERIHARIMNRYGGERNFNKPLILPPGFKAKALSIKPNEMYFGESADRMRDNILAAFAVPKIVAGLMDNMTFGSIQAGNVGFCSFKINPILVYRGQVITEKLAKKYDTKLRCWWPDSTPEDAAQRERELLTDIKAGTITKNELRAIRGRAPWPPEIGDLPAGEADLRGSEHGSGNRNPDYPSNEEADRDRKENPEGE